MAAVTVSHADKSFIACLGPFYIEVVHVQSPSNDDTYSSKLASPSFAVLLPAGDAAGSMNCSASVSGKTVTLRDPVSSLNHVLIVFGNNLT